MSAITLPFAHLNLRRNPFGELDRAERGEIVVADVDALAGRLARPGFAVQLLGPSGSGKTSHLIALHRRFADAPFVHVEVGRRTRVPAGSPLFLDDALFLRRRQTIFRRRRTSFVLTTHVDLTAELEEAGLEVVTVRPAELLDDERLAALLERRIDAARRGPGPLPAVSAGSRHRLRKRHGVNVRAMERDLYRAFQELEEVADVEV